MVVLTENQLANQLSQKLHEAKTPLLNCKLIKPSTKSSDLNSLKTEEANNESQKVTTNLKPVDIDSIEMLNPKLSKQLRQKSMASWLMPFGFIAGLTFTQMTGLKTFSSWGLGNLGSFGEPLLGSLLGMGSGWIGSYAAAISVNPDKNDDVRSLRKRSEAGNWLLLLETPIETELPWHLVQEVKPIEVVRLRDL